MDKFSLRSKIAFFQPLKMFFSKEEHCFIIEQNNSHFENLLYNFDLIITENEISIHSDNKIVMYLKVAAVLLSKKRLKTSVQGAS